MDCRLEDAGEYGIEAENSLGRDWTHCVVRVTDAATNKPSPSRGASQKPEIGAPIILRPLQDYKVHFGNQVLLECEVQTSPETSFEWRHNGQMVLIYFLLTISAIF
jgi:hypothetical protein